MICGRNELSNFEILSKNTHLSLTSDLTCSNSSWTFKFFHFLFWPKAAFIHEQLASSSCVKWLCPFRAHSNFKLKVSSLPCGLELLTYHSRNFYETCPSIMCTHNTPIVTHKLGQVWDKNIMPQSHANNARECPMFQKYWWWANQMAASEQFQKKEKVGTPLTNL